MINIERRLRRLEDHTEASASEVFMISGYGGWSEDRVRSHLGIIEKPGRELRIIERAIVDMNRERTAWVSHNGTLIT